MKNFLFSLLWIFFVGCANHDEAKVLFLFGEADSLEMSPRAIEQCAKIYRRYSCNVLYFLKDVPAPVTLPLKKEKSEYLLSIMYIPSRIDFLYKNINPVSYWNCKFFNMKKEACITEELLEEWYNYKK